jgi:hypothetical protein
MINGMTRDLMIESLENELKNLRGDIRAKKVLIDGCDCGHETLTLNSIREASTGRKIRTFLCKNCGEIWTEYSNDIFTSKKETKFIEYKKTVRNALRSLKNTEDQETEVYNRKGELV